MPFANVSKSQEEIEAEEEEILRKYGGEDSEEENDAEPGKIIISLYFQCLSRLFTLCTWYTIYCYETSSVVKKFCSIYEG